MSAGWLTRGNLERVHAEVAAMLRDGRAMEPELARSITTEVLTGQQCRIVGLMARGLDNQAIADRLNIMVTTVAVHKTAIRQRIGVSSMTELVVVAVRVCDALRGKEVAA